MIRRPAASMSPGLSRELKATYTRRPSVSARSTMRESSPMLKLSAPARAEKCLSPTYTASAPAARADRKQEISPAGASISGGSFVFSGGSAAESSGNGRGSATCRSSIRIRTGLTAEDLRGLGVSREATGAFSCPLREKLPLCCCCAGLLRPALRSFFSCALRFPCLSAGADCPSFLR